VNRTNTQGFPAWVDSPWMLSKISVTRTPLLYPPAMHAAT
jgi:hypothetical protein